MLHRFAVAAAVSLVALVALCVPEHPLTGQSPGPAGAGRDGYLFRFDTAAGRVEPRSDRVEESFHLELAAVTVDQPQYWPHETVNLAAFFPDFPDRNVTVTVLAKDGEQRPLPTARLNPDGVLCLPVMSGEKERMRLGQYHVEVAVEGAARKATAEFSVVEGALGAVSFAHEFARLSGPKELDECQAGWFLGNAAGAGVRWGNGLSFKNELRASNRPFTGPAVLKTRCMLPGCNGIEAGPQRSVQVVDGKLGGTLDVSSHSGPFELEVITPGGTVRHLFSGSSHVEREMFKLTSGLSRVFRAGLAPYAGARQVPGRQIFVEEDKGRTDDPVEIERVVATDDGTVSLRATREIESLTVFTASPRPGKGFERNAPHVVGRKLARGESTLIPIAGPWTLVAVGGLVKGGKPGEATPFEGHALAFAPTGLSMKIDVPATGSPLRATSVRLTVLDRLTRRGKAVSGVLVVHDNRVASKDPAAALASRIGDSFRDASGLLTTREESAGITTWRRLEGQVKSDQDALAPGEEEPGSANAGLVNLTRSYVDKLTRMAPDERQKLTSSIVGFSGSSGRQTVGPAPEDVFREGDRKVVFAGLVRTDRSGEATVEMVLPPQTCRLTVRYVALAGYDHLSGQTVVDVSSQGQVECHLLPLMLPGARVQAEAVVDNLRARELSLMVSGAGVQGQLKFTAVPGRSSHRFAIEGGTPGPLILELVGADGKPVDRRKIQIATPAAQPVLERDLIVSDGRPIRVEPGWSATVFPGPGPLLKGLVGNLETCIASWFGHGEALTAGLAAKATILAAIEAGLLDEDQRSRPLVLSIRATVKDLKERFLDTGSGLFVPYPGMAPSERFSLFMLENLRASLRQLVKLKRHGRELRETVQTAGSLAETVTGALIKSTSEPGVAKTATAEAIEIWTESGGRIHLLTDDAALQWVRTQVLGSLDGPTGSGGRIALTAADLERVRRAFERTGELPHLIQAAKVLVLSGGIDTPEFHRLFARIARRSILTEESGVIQGPALTGGIYSTPQTSIRFLELLMMMAEKGALATGPVAIVRAGATTGRTLDSGALRIDADPVGFELSAPARAIVQLTRPRTLDLSTAAGKLQGIRATLSSERLAIGGEATLEIALPAGLDNAEHVALVVLPATVVAKQTEDSLASYQGDMIYGQRASGGQRMQTLGVPFRGSSTMRLLLEGAQKGTAPGLVVVRSIRDVATATARPIGPIRVE